MSQAYPLRKTQGLVIEKMGDEQLVYHTERGQAFHLNAQLAEIWELCDGQRSVAQIANLLQNLPQENREAFVAEGLRQLGDNGLLLDLQIVSPLSRRKLLRGLGKAAAVAPLLTMVMVPAAAAAASAGANPCANCGGVSNPPCPTGCSCTASADCQSGNCTGQVCR